MLEREANYENPGGDDRWVLGNKARNRGSLISDVWRGTAYELSKRNALTVFPTSGWWKDARVRGKSESATRYSLLIGLRVSADVDIYTPITTLIEMIGAENEVENDSDDAYDDDEDTEL